MEISRKIAVACAWCICAALIVMSLTPFYLQEGHLLKQAGGIGALLLIPMGLLFRSERFAQFIRTAPYEKLPVWTELGSIGMLVYAVCAVVFFVVLWVLKSPISNYGNVMLAPFGAFAFYMGRWALFRA
jgi:hypothetical protein